MSEINIALDIDRVLAYEPHGDQDAFFEKHGAVISIFVRNVLEKYYIAPGTMELLKTLDQNPNVKVSFFSSGAPDRNITLIEELLIKTFGRELYPDVKDRFKIIQNSQILTKDLLRLTEMKEEELEEKIKFLQNTLLVDDDLFNIVDPTGENPSILSQKANFLYCPPTEGKNFAKLLNKYDYRLDGTKLLKCTLVPEERQFSDSQVAKVLKGTDIFISKIEKNYEICFYNTLQSRVEFQPVLVADEKLLAALDLHYEKDEIMYSKLVKEEELKSLIFDFVSQRNGKITKISRQVNRICYVAGLLDHLLKTSLESEKSVAEILYTHQWLDRNKRPQVENVIACPRKSEQFYHTGLKVLQSINPDYKFISPHSEGLQTISRKRVHD